MVSRVGNWHAELLILAGPRRRIVNKGAGPKPLNYSGHMCASGSPPPRALLGGHSVTPRD